MTFPHLNWCLRHDPRASHITQHFWPRVRRGKVWWNYLGGSLNLRTDRIHVLINLMKLSRWSTKSSWAITCRGDNTGASYLISQLWLQRLQEARILRIHVISHQNHQNHLHSRWIVGSGSHAGVYPEDKKFRKSIVKALDAVPGT